MNKQQAKSSGFNPKEQAMSSNDISADRKQNEMSNSSMSVSAGKERKVLLKPNQLNLFDKNDNGMFFVFYFG